MKFAKSIPLFFAGITLLSYFGAFNVLSEANARLPAIVDGRTLPSLADMLERVTPAVVNISTETDSGSVKDPVYRHFFGKTPPSKRISFKSIFLFSKELRLLLKVTSTASKSHIVSKSEVTRRKFLNRRSELKSR